MIKMQLIGHLGKDAVVNQVNGRSVINFTVAHSERYKDAQGNTVDKTIWVDCAQWTDRTAVAPYLKKGTQVFVEGNPDVRTYTTQDGKNGATLTMKVQSVQLLGTKGSEGGESSGSNYGSNAASTNNQYAQSPAYNQSFTPPPPANNANEPFDDLPF